MFVSIGALLTRTTAGAIIVELTTDDGYRGDFLVDQALLPCEHATHHIPVILHPPKESRPKHSKKKMKRASVKQEEKLAQTTGGRRHYGSGNQTGYEGDVRVAGKYRIEAKYTMKKSYSVRRTELDKIRSECALGEIPVFVVDFKDPQTLRTEDSWVLVPRSEWEKHAKATDD